MRFSLIAAAAFAGSAIAAPAPAPEAEAVAFPPWMKKPVPCREGVRRPGCVGRPKPKPVKKCMNKKQADSVAATFQSLIQGYTIEQAEAALTKDFVDYSSAVSIVINKGAAEPEDITQPIFTSREEFMMGHGKQKPIPFETLDVWHNCNGTVSMRWLTTRSAMDQPTEAAAIPVPGLVILETEPSDADPEYPYVIHTIYSEFNSAAWLVNLGVFTPAGPVIAPPADKRDVVARNPAPRHWSEVGMI